MLCLPASAACELTVALCELFQAAIVDESARGDRVIKTIVGPAMAVVAPSFSSVKARERDISTVQPLVALNRCTPGIVTYTHDWPLAVWH